MKSVLAITASALFISAASASNYTFNPNEVDSTTKFTWCKAELESCPKICVDGATTNTCDSTALTYDCTCDNGTTIDVSPYENTLPYFICEQTYIQCIAANPNDADAQSDCTTQRNDDCGTLNPDNVTSSAATTSAAATTAAATTTSLATSTSAAATAASASASATSSSKSLGIKLGQNFGFGVVAAVFAMAGRLLL